MTEVSYAPGDVLVREGEPADHMFVVLEGEMGEPSAEPVHVRH